MLNFSTFFSLFVLIKFIFLKKECTAINIICKTYFQCFLRKLSRMRVFLSCTRMSSCYVMWVLTLYFLITLNIFNLLALNLSWPILESKFMRAIFQKKGKKRTKKCLKKAKRAKYLKIWPKMYKI